MAFGTESVNARKADAIVAAAQRVAAGVPVQYVLGYTEFCRHRIMVEPGVLIPRPETEEMTLRIIEENPHFNGVISDLGTGSGCIAISLSLGLPGSTVYAVDNSDKALMMAEKNAIINEAYIHLIKADILSQPSAFLPMSSIIVSNPPYVRESEKTLMQRNVLDHEPFEALFVPDDNPLLYYSRIAEIAEERLLKGGFIYLEINEALAVENFNLFAGYHFTEISIIKDIRGKKRILKARKNG